MKLSNWKRAHEIVHGWEAGEPEEVAKPMEVDSAITAFESDAKARGLLDSTLLKYKVLFQQLRGFAAQKGYRFLKEFTVEVVREFRASWPDQPISALKKLERMRAFLRFCADAGWVADNAAVKVKAPKVDHRPTMPFSLGEMRRILAACDKYPDNYGNVGGENAVRLRALVLLMRFSGMRIGDCVTLSRDRLNGTNLLLYTQKTRVPVYCPLPPEVADALHSAPHTNNEFFFWTGESKAKSSVGNWQRSLRKLFKLAGVPDGHAHRFRDTFAVEFLQAGNSLEDLAVLLGHRSIRITEKHYSPWVKARQERLEDRVRSSWDSAILSGLHRSTGV